MAVGSLVLSFAAGVLWILSRCVLPILPVMLGAAASQQKAGPVALAARLSIWIMPDFRRSRPQQRRLVAGSEPQSAAASPSEPSAIARQVRRHDWSSLMVRAQEDDRQAYQTLLQEITPYLRALAARIFRSPDDIEDAVQDVLLAVHSVRRTYDPSRPFGPWLVAIAKRRIIECLRRNMRARARQTKFTIERETFLPVAANLGSTLHDFSADEAALYAALGELSADQRQAIHLLKIKEMSLKEAAAASGRSVNALKVATHRGIARLRKLLVPPGDAT
jgi:RNA polymerase sigma-70 factor, ECF subfamily